VAGGDEESKDELMRKRTARQTREMSFVNRLLAKFIRAVLSLHGRRAGEALLILPNSMQVGGFLMFHSFYHHHQDRFHDGFHSPYLSIIAFSFLR
jgi:hypothetical protein